MILALSDTHGLLPDLDISGIDRILMAGDVCPTTDHSGQRQRRWLERNFSAWIEHLGLPVYLALGNHDFVDVVTAGDARLDNKKFRAAFGWKPHMLRGDDTERLTGHAPGGVCPFGLPEETRVRRAGWMSASDGKVRAGARWFS